MIIFSLSDHVEAVFKLTGKITVDQMVEMGFKELGYSKRRIGRNQGFSVSSRIRPILNRADNRGIGTGPSDASLFEFLHQSVFPVTTRRVRLMTNLLKFIDLRSFAFR